MGYLGSGKSEEKKWSLLYSRDASVLCATVVDSEQFLPVNASQSNGRKKAYWKWWKFLRMNLTVNRCKARCNFIINAIHVFFFFVIVSDRHLSWPHPLFWEGKIVGVINSLHPIISMHFLYTIDKTELIEWSRTFQVVDQLLYSHALRVWKRGDLWGEISYQGYNVER